MTIKRILTSSPLLFRLLNRLLPRLTIVLTKLLSIAPHCCQNFGVAGGACEGMLKLQFAATPHFSVGTPNQRSALGQLLAGPDLVTLVGLKIITVASRIQPQRF